MPPVNRSIQDYKITMAKRIKVDLSACEGKQTFCCPQCGGFILKLLGGVNAAEGIAAEYPKLE